MPYRVLHYGFRRVWASAGLSSFGESVTEIALPLMALAMLDASPLVLAALLAVEQAAWLLIGLPAGVWLDRVRVRRALQLSYVARAVALSSVPMAYLVAELTMIHLFAAAIVTGVAGVFSSVGEMAIVPQIVPTDGLVKANARLSATTTATSLAGQSAGGVLVAGITAPIAMLVEAATSAASVVVLRRVRSAVPDRTGERPRFWADLREGLRYTLTHRLFRVLAIVTSLGNALVAAQYVLVFVFLAETLAVPEAVIGVLIAASAAGGMAGAAVCNRLTTRYGTGRVWRTALVAGPVLGLLIPIAQPGGGLVWFVPGSLGLTAATAVVSIISGSARQAACPPELIGRLSATSRTLTWGVIPFGLLAGGALGSAVGTRSALWMLAAALFLPAVLAWLSPLRRSRELTSTAGGSAATTYAGGE
jgi:hypothetical protein